MREAKRHVEQERNQRIVLENKLMLLASEKQEMQRYSELNTGADIHAGHQTFNRT